MDDQESKKKLEDLWDEFLGKESAPTSIKELLNKQQEERKEARESVIPMRVDTLRDDFSCPIDLGSQCGLDLPEEGETCSVCGFTVPSKSLSDPDLSKAKRVKKKMEIEDEQRKEDGHQIDWR